MSKVKLLLSFSISRSQFPAIETTNLIILQQEIHTAAYFKSLVYSV